MNAQELYRSKLTTADDAVSRITSGSRVLVGSGCAEPQELVRCSRGQVDERASREQEGDAESEGCETSHQNTVIRPRSSR